MRSVPSGGSSDDPRWLGRRTALPAPSPFLFQATAATHPRVPPAAESVPTSSQSLRTRGLFLYRPFEDRPWLRRENTIELVRRPRSSPGGVARSLLNNHECSPALIRTVSAPLRSPVLIPAPFEKREARSSLRRCPGARASRSRNT